ncbi:MAG TPA: LLM class flavin-dependent oxidoreductase [Acidimicrobiia bacterium]|nr:LLM class flavin-dependent oxidoreductase [Acidimicrobiia bacterium]
MRIGVALRMIEGSDGQVPRWEHVRAQALAAEEAGFDLVTIADAITENGRGYWEGMTLAGALADATSTIGVAHSVVNAPYRSPAVVARAADTLDEITGGRYVLGIGAGNTPDDYAMFAMDADPRFSRFAEDLEVIASLLRTGRVDFDGRFEHAHADWWRPRGPRPEGPPIVVAAGGPKMVELAARLADGWNWWADASGAADHLPPIIERLDRHLEGRPIQRSIDMYSFDPLALLEDPPPGVASGSAVELASPIVALKDLGIDEVRVEVLANPSRLAEATRAMSEVVSLVHDA